MRQKKSSDLFAFRDTSTIFVGSPAHGERAVTEATVMTSPQAVQSDVVAESATDIKVEPPPVIEHTAGESSQAEPNATTTSTTDHVADPIANDGNEVIEDVVTGAELPQKIEEPIPVDLADAAIPITENDAQLQISELPPNMIDFSQMGPIDSLLAYAQPFPALPVTDYAQLALPAAIDALDGGRQPFLDPSPYIHEQDETRVSAYAKLEFSDGEFYMNTYSVVLGRDQAAMRVALRREQEERKRIDEEASATKEPKTPVPYRREHSRYSKSVVSESGGILRDVEETGLVNKSKKSKSTGSSSRHPSRRNSVVQQNESFDYQAQPLASHNAPESEARLHPAALRPSPHDCPLVTIHPPATESASGYKAISRSHVKIAYSLKKHLFEAHILGRNGAFVDDNFWYQDQVVPLKSGSMLQIGGVQVRFVLPDVAVGETGAEHRAEYEDNTISERYAEGGKEMSFDFEESIHDGIARETSSELSEERDSDEDGHDHSSDDDDADQDGVNVSDQSDNEDVSHLQEAVDIIDSSPPKPPMPEKKRGPGRPPKNGIMSKREQQLIKKEAAARAAAEAAGPIQGSNLPNVPVQDSKSKKTVIKTEPLPDGTVAPVPVKNKVGRPRKHPRPDTPPVQREKRKYTKRKPKEPKEGEGKEGGSGDEEAKEKKEKPPKPPRSPTPTFNEADLTPEQLAKPQANYVTLIHEALSSSAAGMMSLPQIYRAIMRKYPFFVLKTTTTGWQSSVRHNLSQHHAFTKVKRDGKGWMWAIVEGVSIEKEKKRRVTPPPQMPHGHVHHQPIYQAGHPPHMMHGQYPYPPPGFMLHPNLRPGQPYPGPPPNGQHYPSQPPPMQMNPHQHPPSGFIPSIPQIAAIAPPQQYSSPYAPKPPSQPPASQSSTPNPGQQQSGSTSDQKPSTEQQNQPSNASPANVPTPSPSVTPAVHQSPYQRHTHPPPQYHPQQPAHQASQQPLPNVNNRPQHPPSVISAVETFRANLLSTLKDKTDNAEAVLASAVNRVLGYITQSAVPGDLYEPQIMEALKSVLSKVPEYKPAVAASGQAQLSQNGITQPRNVQANQEGPQGSALQQPPKSTGPQNSATPSVMRPSFGGAVNRPNGSSIARPAVMTPGVSPGAIRTDSASPAPTRSDGPVVSTLPSAPNQNLVTEPPVTTSHADKTGVSPPLVSPIAQDINKTIPTSSMPLQSAAIVSPPIVSPVPTPVMSPITSETKLDLTGSDEPTGQKRSIEEVSGENEVEMPDSKRLATSASPPSST